MPAPRQELERLRALFLLLVTLLWVPKLLFCGTAVAAEERADTEVHPGLAGADDWLEATHNALFLRKYLFLGPFMKGMPRSPRVRWAMSRDLLDGESEVRPMPGELRAGHEWQIRTSQEDVVDLDRVLEPGGALAYAAVTVVSLEAQDGRLFVNSEGPMDVWLNSERVYSWRGLRSMRHDGYQVPVRLEEGENHLLIKIARGHRWRFSTRLATQEGTSLPGVHPAAFAEPPPPPSIPPLVLAPGERVRIPLGASGSAPVRLETEGLPGFASLDVDTDPPVLLLEPGPRARGYYPDAAILVECEHAVTRVPIPIHVTRGEGLEVTPGFDALVGGRYALRFRDRFPDGTWVELGPFVEWSSRPGDVEQTASRGSAASMPIVSDGRFQALEPGEITLSGRYQGLEADIPIRVVAGAPEFPFTMRVPTITTLVSVYRKPGCEDCAARARESAMHGREFFYRNTHGQLNLDLSFKEKDGSIPRYRGSYWRGMARDLRRRGVRSGHYGLIVGLGPSEGPCYGSGRLLGAGGVHCSVLHPSYFVHEVQHTLDRVIADGSGLPQMMYGHGYTEPSAFGMSYFPVIAGRGADWEAAILRHFDAYDRFKSPWDNFIEVADSDGDGLADHDSRLPMDEARFGSDPDRADTDGDGLADLEEFEAGIYLGSNPNRADTDGDGQPDGKDLYPLYRTSPDLEIPFAAEAPVLDGSLDENQPLLIDGINTSGQCWNLSRGCQSDAGARVYATWNESALFLTVEADQPIRGVLVNIDGSGWDGPWLGGDFYVVRTSRRDKELTRYAGELANTRVGPERVPEGRVVWGGEGGRHILEMKIPAGLGQGYGWDRYFYGLPCAPGLRLEAGRQIRLSFELELRDVKATMFEEQVFVPFRLGASRDDLESVGTRPSEGDLKGE